MDVITDTQIKLYLDEVKILPKDFKPRFRERLGHELFEREVFGTNGNTFKIIIRKSKINPLDFSVILGIIIGGKTFRLKRYNGNSHDHTNKLEKKLIEGFHIHTATQRYQENGFREEGFAEETTSYSDWDTALKAMIRENNFQQEITIEQERLKEDYDQ